MVTVAAAEAALAEARASHARVVAEASELHLRASDQSEDHLAASMPMS